MVADIMHSYCSRRGTSPVERHTCRSLRVAGRVVKPIHTMYGK